MQSVVLIVTLQHSIEFESTTSIITITVVLKFQFSTDFLKHCITHFLTRVIRSLWQLQPYMVH